MKSKVRTVIEMTDTQIRVFQAVRSATGLVLNFFDARDIMDLAEGAISKVLVDIIKNGRGLIRPLGEVIAIIPRQYAIVRTLVLPSHNPSELREMALLQSTQHIPYNRDEVVLDVHPVLQTPDGFSRVFLIVVPKEKIGFYWRIFQAAHVTPAQITISSLGIFQWFKTRLLPLDEVVMLVNIDEQISEICLCDQHKIYALRLMIWGAGDCRAKEFTEFMRQIEITLNHYQREKIGRDVASILIMSSLDNDRGLCEAVGGEFGLPVGFKRVTQDVAMRKSLVWPRLVLDAGCSVTAGLGVTLCPVNNDIDFIPMDIKEQLRKLKTKRHLIGLSIWGGVAIVFVLLAMSMGLFEQRAMLAKWEKDLDGLKPSIQKFEQQSKDLQELKSVFGDRIIFAQLISQLNQMIPNDMALVSFSITQGKTMVLQGYARNPQDINQLQKSMADAGIFLNVTLDYVNKRTTDKGELNYFKLTSQIKSGGSV